VTITIAPTVLPNAEGLKEVLIEILVTYLGVSRSQLEESGPGMPVDSLDLFDVLPEFWKATGLKVPTKELRRRNMRSIDSFIAYVSVWGAK
jgi:acyl carrier protein